MATDALPADMNRSEVNRSGVKTGDRTEPSLNRSRVPEAICGDFRTKTMYLTVTERDFLEEDPHCHTAVFWCLRTQGAYGPDDREVDPERCRSTRGCYRV
jgi:hypothetical protein